MSPTWLILVGLVATSACNPSGSVPPEVSHPAESPGQELGNNPTLPLDEDSASREQAADSSAADSHTAVFLVTGETEEPAPAGPAYVQPSEFSQEEETESSGAVSPDAESPQEQDRDELDAEDPDAVLVHRLPPDPPEQDPDELETGGPDELDAGGPDELDAQGPDELDAGDPDAVLVLGVPPDPAVAETTSKDGILYAALKECFTTTGVDRIREYYLPRFGKLSLTCSDGWLVWLKRVDGAVSFGRPWTQYKAGFGDPYGEFWLGLELLHQITNEKSYRLKVEMSDWNGLYYFSDYRSFSVGPNNDGYRLAVGGYDPVSSAGDSLLTDYNGIHNRMRFSTYDRDNDIGDGTHCSTHFGNAGWWYARCHSAHPTGVYLPGGATDARGIAWRSTFSSYYSFKTMEYKIRPN